MPWFDLPLDQLRGYRTDTAEPPELDQWWQRRLEAARASARPPTLTRYEADTYAPVEVYDTEFSGAGGDRIRAWYLRPAGADGQTPVVVKFIGYGGGRGLPAEHALLPALGYALFVMDTRGQGGRSSTGATGDYPGDPAREYQSLHAGQVLQDLLADGCNTAHLGTTAHAGTRGRPGRGTYDHWRGVT